MVQSLPPQLGIPGTPIALPFGQHTAGQQTVGLFFILYACRPNVCLSDCI